MSKLVKHSFLEKTINISFPDVWKVEQKDSGSMVYFYVEFNAPILLRPFMQQTLIDTFANKFIHAFLKRVR